MKNMNELKQNIMSSENDQKQPGNNRVWILTAVVSGIFAILISVLLIANYLQYKKADPVNMTVMSSLVSRLNDNPADSALRTEIRSLDLLYRKAYFTSQWQIRTGGYLLLAAVALVIISLQVIEYRKKINPRLSSVQEDIIQSQRRKARIWIIAGGGTILAVAVIFAFLGSNDLGKKFSDISNGVTSAQEIKAKSGNTETTIVATQEALPSESNPGQSVADTMTQAAAPASGDDNFPNFRGNGGTGIVTKKNIPESWDGPSGINLLWKTAIPLPGYSSPVIWGDKVFVTGADNSRQEVYGIDRNTGKIIWTVKVGTGNKKPTLSDYTGHAPSTAVTDGSGVYAIFPTGDMIALDMNGKKIWEKDLGLPDNHYGHASSLMMHGGNIILQFDEASSPRIIAINAKTGQTTWSTDHQVSTSWSSPIIINSGNRTELLLLADPGISSFDPVNGRQLWKIDCISGEIGTSLAYSDGIVYGVNENSRLAAVKLGDQPSVLWEENEFLSDIPSPVANEKYLFLATSYGMVICYDAKTGEKYWEHNYENNIYSSPIIINNKVYILDFKGIMHIIKADRTYTLIKESALGENCLCTPAFTNGRIYLRGTDNIYCIGK